MMLNFKEIENIKNKKTDHLKQSKNQHFESVLQQGLMYLDLAHQERFKHAKTLQKSCELLIDAIVIHRNDIRPYLALAFIFTLLEEYKTASEYVYGALQIDPNCQEAIDIANTLSEFKIEAQQEQVKQVTLMPEADVSANLLDKSEVSDIIDYDALYDRLEVFILEKVKILVSSEHQNIEPTLELKNLDRLRNNLERIKKLTAYIKKQLKVIEEEIDATDLRTKSKPFTVLVKRYIRAINVSEVLMEINDTIELWSFKTNKQLQVVNQTLTMSALTYGRVDVGRMMDGCDLIADQLDALTEVQNIDISLIESSYEKLLNLITELDKMAADIEPTDKKDSKLAHILS